jgi:glutamate mutase epsilon subunit
MVEVPMPGYQAFLADKRVKLKTEYRQWLGQFPDAEAQLKLIFKVVCHVEEVAGHTPA